MGKVNLKKFPITEEELKEVKKNCRIGDKVRVFNDWRTNLKKTQRSVERYGRWEESKIIRKFSHVALLENGRYVDYVEIAIQRRKAKK